MKKNQGVEIMKNEGSLINFGRGRPLKQIENIPFREFPESCGEKLKRVAGMEAPALPARSLKNDLRKVSICGTLGFFWREAYMKYVVYCDESRHDGHTLNPYMAIGSLWMPREDRDYISRVFKACCRTNGLGAEIKWSKVSSAKLESYKRLIDFFFEQENLEFRAIVVDQSKVNYGEFHGNDRELGFYKFYYEMLWHWFAPQNEYLILLDFIQNKEAHRFTELRKVLENQLKGCAWITDLTVIDSHKTPLGQLVDLITGAVAAAWCDNLPNDSSKRDLIAYISEKRGSSLLDPSPSSAHEKLNLFKIRLS